MTTLLLLGMESYLTPVSNAAGASCERKEQGERLGPAEPNGVRDEIETRLTSVDRRRQ